MAALPGAGRGQQVHDVEGRHVGAGGDPEAAPQVVALPVVVAGRSGRHVPSVGVRPRRSRSGRSGGAPRMEPRPPRRPQRNRDFRRRAAGPVAAARVRGGAGGDRRGPLHLGPRPPQPPALPRARRAAGGVRLRHRLRRRPARARPRLRRAGDHPGRGRHDDPVVRHQTGDAHRCAAGHPRGRGEHRGDGGAGATTSSGSAGSWRCCWPRSPPPPMPRRCSPCSGACRCRAA